MIILNKDVKIMTDNIEEKALGQVVEIANHPAFKDKKIRIQADCHAGAGCVIGFTGELGNKIIPNVSGVDLNCGMLTVKLGRLDVDFEALDFFIRKTIPYGHSVNEKASSRIPKGMTKSIKDICSKLEIEPNRPLKSIGSLGGGNHFIEINEDSEGCKYLVIHSGSRNFGLQIAKYHQNKAIKHCQEKRANIKNARDIAIKKAHEEGLSAEGLEDIQSLYNDHMDIYKVRKDLSFLEQADLEEYLRDVKVARDYASLNREIMARRIVKEIGLNYEQLEHFETVHNYISDDGIIRKGAISAQLGEKVLIPINMRDGSIIAMGKGNPDYNCSAPHGAGRMMSRSGAKEKLSLEEFQETMSDVWTSCVKQSTLDEAPMAYKDVNEIIENTKDTIDIVDIIKPLYNFKAN